jgi:hypothetical protein
MLCRLFQFMISSAADSGNPVGPATSRHIAHCEGCRHFLRSCQQLAGGLRSEAAKVDRDAACYRLIPLDLTQVRASTRRFPARVVFAAAACIAIAAVVTPLLLTSPKPAATPVTRMGIAIPAGTQWAVKSVEVIQTPLAAEARNLTSDAKSGIRFLAACLDVRPLGTDAVLRPGEMAPPPLR